MLEEESARVAVTFAVIGVPALVETFAEHVAAKGYAAVHQQARQLAELDVGQAGAAEGETAPVADRDVAAAGSLRQV